MLNIIIINQRLEMRTDHYVPAEITDYRGQYDICLSVHLGLQFENLFTNLTESGKGNVHYFLI